MTEPAERDKQVLDYAPPPPPLLVRDSMEYYREPPALDPVAVVLTALVFVAVACYGFVMVLMR